MKQEKSSSGIHPSTIIVIVLTLALIGVAAMFFYQKHENDEIVFQLNNEKDSIQGELEQMVVGYDSLRTENDTLNENMAMAQEKVRSLLEEIEQNKKASYSEISKYKHEVTTLRKIMRNYVVQIDSLNRRNEELMAENRSVRQEMSQVRNQQKELKDKNQKLQERVDVAAALDARDLVAYGVKRNGKQTPKASKATQIMVSFTLSKNITAKRGNKPLYVRIVRPDQVLLTESESNTFPFEDLNIPYSAMREVEYEGNSLPVSVYWDNQGEEFMSGDYTVDVFADGRNIGTTKFHMK